MRHLICRTTTTTTSIPKTTKLPILSPNRTLFDAGVDLTSVLTWPHLDFLLKKQSFSDLTDYEVDASKKPIPSESKSELVAPTLIMPLGWQLFNTKKTDRNTKNKDHFNIKRLL